MARQKRGKSRRACERPVVVSRLRQANNRQRSRAGYRELDKVLAARSTPLGNLEEEKVAFRTTNPDWVLVWRLPPSDASGSLPARWSRPTWIDILLRTPQGGAAENRRNGGCWQTKHPRAGGRSTINASRARWRTGDPAALFCGARSARVRGHRFTAKGHCWQLDARRRTKDSFQHVLPPAYILSHSIFVPFPASFPPPSLCPDDW